MQYFRVCANPLDPYVQNGGVLLRLPVRMRNQMFYCTFQDGGYLKVPDNEMGEAGPALDCVTLGLEPPLEPYKLFQSSVLPNGVVEADIPLWSSQLVPLVQPPEPMPQPTAWPVLSVVVAPE